MTTIRNHADMSTDALAEAISAGHMDIDRALEIISAWPVIKRRQMRELIADLATGNFHPSAAGLLKRLDGQQTKE